jgi:hypothetical protein
MCSTQLSLVGVWAGKQQIAVRVCNPYKATLGQQPPPVKTQYRERYTSLTGSVPLMPRCKSTVSTISAGRNAHGLSE